MKNFRFLIALVAITFSATIIMDAQVAINDDGTPPHSSAMLDVSSTSLGLLIPRMPTANRLTMSAVEGMIVFDTGYNEFYFYNGSVWQELSAGSLWLRSGSHTYLANPNDKVGIGTSTPSQPISILTSTVGAFFEAKSTAGWAGLIIDKAAVSGKGYIIFRTGGSSKWYTGTLANNDYAISTTSSSSGSKLYIESSGDVGIGTNAPAYALDILRPAGVNAFLRVKSGNLAGLFLDKGAIDDNGYILYRTNGSNDWAAGTIGNQDYAISTSPSLSDCKLYIESGGNVGIGTTSPKGKFHVHDAGSTLGNIHITPMGSNDSARIYFGENSTGTLGMYWLYDGGGNQMELWGNSSSTHYGPHLTVDRSDGDMTLGGSLTSSGNVTMTGNVAIGGSTFATGYDLSVDGKIICEELRVNMSGNWPDYVFRKDYDLMTIPELSRFIEQNGHLPEVPAASEIEKTGIDVGEMQKIMMKKIEELSLYIIQQQEGQEELSNYIIKQQEEIDELKNELAKIRK